MYQVVIVEDTPDILRLIDYILSGDRDIEVVGTYRNVKDALYHDWVNADTAIVDWMMPENRGDTLLAWLKKTHPHVRRIMLSAAVTPDRTRADAHAFVQKGGDFQELVRAVKGQR